MKARLPFSLGEMVSADRLRTADGRATIGELGRCARRPGATSDDRAARARRAMGLIARDRRDMLAEDEVASLEILARMWAGSDGRTFADHDHDIPHAGLPMSGVAREPLFSNVGCALA